MRVLWVIWFSSWTAFLLILSLKRDAAQEPLWHRDSKYAKWARDQLQVASHLTGSVAHRVRFPASHKHIFCGLRIQRLAVFLFSAGCQTLLTGRQSPTLHLYRDGQSARRQVWLEGGRAGILAHSDSSTRRWSPVWQKTFRCCIPLPHVVEH